ncbi:glycosyltransferase family A protein [uncultured Methylobacterium sp.]|jgi:glycosyltransferase involved in cell wall biosynthesis|uniref:glycosyltransferase family 2 protein n=1 Tax=uncultured Methylobacterium sp. TaxID=157278 RepID=UPI002606ED14|nr:glycosyltransferase family A protein [uncultured Methylobacterium sp.]
MQIAIVTPYHNEDIALIRQAHESVLAQDFACRHVLVADGHPHPEIDDWNCEHIVLPGAHKDWGGFARGMGAMHAVHDGVDFVAFLDADNWLEPNHASSLAVQALNSGTAITVSRRSLRRIDGSLMRRICPESEGDNFADTGTILYHRSVLDVISLWARMPRALSSIGDQIVWRAIKERGYPCAHTGLPTLNYRTKFVGHYRMQNEEPPLGAIDFSHIKQGYTNWEALNDLQKQLLLKGH